MIKYFIVSLLPLASLYAMTLDETLTYALEHNNALKQSTLSVERSQTLKDAKKAENFGQINLLASYDHYNNARTLTPLTPMSIVGSPDGAYTIPTTKDLFSLGVSYSVVLFDGFAQQSSYKITDLQHISSSIKNHLGREELIYNVRNLYLSILGLKETLQAKKSYELAQQKLYDNVLEEFKLGSKSKLELLKAHTSLEESHSEIVSLNANITILKATLTHLMGGKEFDKAQSIKIDIPKENTLLISAIDDSDINSLQRYKAAELGVTMSKRKQEKVDSTYYPRIDFSAYYGENFGPNDTQNVVPPTSTAPTAGQTLISEGDFNSETNWQVGLHLKWNILNFGVTSAQSQEAKLAYLDSKLQSQGVALELHKSIAIAKSKIELALAQYNNTLAQYKLLDETQKIEQIRYDNDALSLSDLLDTDAKKELVYAQMVDAKYSYQRAQYYLDYLLEKGEEK